MANTISQKIPYPVVRVPASQWKFLTEKGFPNAGPKPCVYGLRKMYYGFDAPLIRCRDYIFHVDLNTYNWMKCYSK